MAVTCVPEIAPSWLAAPEIELVSQFQQYFHRMDGGNYSVHGIDAPFSRLVSDLWRELVSVAPPSPAIAGRPGAVVGMSLDPQ
jgi:hypothetical protein